MSSDSRCRALETFPLSEESEVILSHLETRLRYDRVTKKFPEVCESVLNSLSLRDSFSAGERSDRLDDEKEAREARREWGSLR